jgi:hypothetical protein
MTKPGFVEKRIEFFINEELKKFDSLIQRNAFLEGVKFIKENIDAFIEKPFYAYVVINQEEGEPKYPILSAHTRETLESMIDDYCGANEKYNNSGKRISYTEHNSKYPSDYQGYYTYEVDAGEGKMVTEYYDVYCVEFKSELVKTKITL